MSSNSTTSETSISSSSTILPPTTTTSSLPPTETTTSSLPPTSTTTSSVPPTSSSTISSSASIPTSSVPPTSSNPDVTTLTTTSNGATVTQTITSTLPPPAASSTGSDASSSTGGAGLITGGDSAGAGLTGAGRIAVAVVVPIAGVALLVVVGIFLWRKRKQRKDAEEERRKEVEDYIYNPNADPTLPDVGSAGGAAGAYEMKEDGSSGYRGWGSTTLAGSTGRKASTTMSGGAAGAAYSDGTSPINGTMSDTRSGEPLMSDGSHSPEGEILGAMGPSAADNRGNVRRGPSNASSQYSTAARSDGSGDNIGVAYGGGGAAYYDQYANNPYSDNPAQRPGELAGQPVIRDNPARRNTRIENPSHYPQQSAGISQNF